MRKVKIMEEIMRQKMEMKEQSKKMEQELVDVNVQERRRKFEQPKEQKFPKFWKDEDYQGFKTKREYWNSGTKLNRKQKVLKFVDAFEE